MNGWSKLKWLLLGGAATLVLTGVSGWLMPATLSDALDRLSRVPSPADAIVLPGEQPAAHETMVEMKLESLKVSGLEPRPVVFLYEKGGERYLPVSIGIAEARAIAIVLQGASPPRPMTHDLLRATIEALGADVQSILIEDLKDGVFYAKVVINVRGKTMELDSRPSDAMALALRTKSPIYATEKLLEKTPTPGSLKGRADM